jgi:flagellin
MTLIAGSGAGLSSMTFTFQAGIASGQTIPVTIDSMATTGLGVASTGASAVNISTFAGAQAAITSIDTAIESVSLSRSAMGATMNQLSFSADNMVNISTNIGASRSSILDTDYATASAQLAKNQIISQAATAMLAQANQQPQSVLTLLK